MERKRERDRGSGRERGSEGRISFHVIDNCIPGFTFSSRPPSILWITWQFMSHLNNSVSACESAFTTSKHPSPTSKFWSIGNTQVICRCVAPPLQPALIRSCVGSEGYGSQRDILAGLTFGECQILYCRAFTHVLTVTEISLFPSWEASPEFAIVQRLVFLGSLHSIHDIMCLQWLHKHNDVYLAVSS